MTKNELMGLLNISMMNCIRQRDCVNPSVYPEEYGYYNGQFRVYESVIGMLATIDVSSVSAVDTRNFVCY